MENFRDVGKSGRRARQVQTVIVGLQALKVGELHDHMHWQDGQLVEDIPAAPVPEVLNRWDDCGREIPEGL